MLNPEEITQKVRELRHRFSTRDQNMNDIYAIRDGRLDEVAPGMFSDSIPKPIIANYIDIAARDTAERLAPLPAFNCSAANMSSDAARKYADKKTVGLNHYFQASALQAQMYSGADYYVSYGLMPAIIEPDWVDMVPRVKLIDPRGCYPENDRFGRLVSFTRVIRKTVSELCNLYPHLIGPITKNGYISANSPALMELIFYHDKDQWCVHLPERHDLVLNWAANPIDEPCVKVAERPGVTDVPRGQFDDVMWIQLAKNRFSMMAMEAAEQAVEAPIAVPYDVQEFAVGPMSTIRTNNPEKVGRVRLELPVGVFQEGAQLSQELMQGARYPETRTGNIDASIITGQGVRALESGFNGAILAGQEVFRAFFRDVARVCMKMDTALWGDVERDIRGQADGVPYSIKWRPNRDLANDFGVSVDYGFAMGLDPNRALVALLQMRGDRLISRDFTRRQFPFGINVSQEEATIEVEELRSALLQSVAALAQSIPVLAQQGQNPGEILAQLGSVITERQKGKTLEQAIEMAFAPPEPAPAEMAQAPGDPMGLMGGGAGPGALGADAGIAPGQMTMGPGGRPDILSMLAGLNSGSGNPTSTVNVKRQIPA
jgi:hypothetical protein